MTAIEKADNSYEDFNTFGVIKFWECPRCKEEFLFQFHDEEPWPFDLKCPSCGHESPIPWPTPPMTAWTCCYCGHVQMASRKNYESCDKTYTHVSGMNTYQVKLSCNRCFRPASDKHDVFYDVNDLIDGLGVGIRKFFGWQAQVDIEDNIRAKDDRENREKAKRAKLAFDNFLKKIPQIRAEQERLAEEERQKAAREAKAREEELKRLKKQARTAVGLKLMKPTNFELAVASLYLKLGYNVYVTPTSGDRGIDLVIVKNKQRVAVQCKRYKRIVPVSQVRDFYGSFVGTYTRGVFITSSAFSKATREWAEQREGLELLNGQQLSMLFVEHEPKIVRNFEKWKELPPNRE